MRILLWLGLAYVAYKGFWSLKRPDWLDDLFTISYAADLVSPMPAEGTPARATWDKAAEAAANYHVPIVWLTNFVRDGYNPAKAAKLIVDHILAAGPPATTDQAALAEYKSKILTTVKAQLAFGKMQTQFKS